MDAVTDDTICLGATVEGMREGGVEALYLGTDEATTVGAGGGKLPHGFLSRLGALLLLLAEKTPVDGESGQLLTLPADIRHPVHGQNLTVLGQVTRNTGRVKRGRMGALMADVSATRAITTGAKMKFSLMRWGA